MIPTREELEAMHHEASGEAEEHEKLHGDSDDAYGNLFADKFREAFAARVIAWHIEQLIKK